jgi:hypothetical protein
MVVSFGTGEAATIGPQYPFNDNQKSGTTVNGMASDSTAEGI